MKKEFVPYELALKLKELGFDEPCFALYLDNDKKTITSSREGADTNSWLKEHYKAYGDSVTAPLFQQAFRWFREKHGMVFNLVGSGPYYPSIAFILIDGNSDIELGEYDNYEEAELACIDKLIDVLETKQQEQ